MKSRIELGDFQTPLPLAMKACAIMKQAGIEPDVLVEPTCGKGNFIAAALDTFPGVAHVHCVELQQDYEKAFWESISRYKDSIDVELYHDDVFTHEFNLSRFREKHILVLGNPPWVTNSELSQLASNNRPAKSNLKKVRGIEALTGKGNFDIAESIIIKMARELRDVGGWIGLLCKNSVILNVIRDARVLDNGLSDMRAYELDTKHEFGISTPGSLFIAHAGTSNDFECRVASFYEPGCITKTFGWVEQRFVSNINKYASTSYLDGKSPLEWRQGVKNDAAKIMVLHRHDESTIVNGVGEVVNIEPDLVYPFVKGSLLKELVTGDTGIRTIITQTKLGEDTATIATRFPRTWHYLNEHGNVLDARKSSMYKNKPRFALFGIGTYAFKPYKVAIASFYKVPHFSLVLPVDGKPTMLDDTCYYVSFDDVHEALVFLVALNSSDARSFFDAISFPDGKRVYSKEILMRLYLGALLDRPSMDGELTRMIKQVPFEISVDKVLASKECLLKNCRDYERKRKNM